MSRLHPFLLSLSDDSEETEYRTPSERENVKLRGELWMRIKIFWFILFINNIFLLSVEAKMINRLEKIYLTAVGDIALDLRKLIPSIKNAYHCEVEIIPGFREVEIAYNKKRKQYYAPQILQELEKLVPSKEQNTRLVGIVDQDLYDEGLNFIFGEARGNTTIVSLWRFKPCTEIDTQEEEKILLDRTIKTVIHELGHTLGLGHCNNRKCVMFFSNWLGDTDYKEKTFCEKCQKKFR